MDVCYDNYTVYAIINRVRIQGIFKDNVFTCRVENIPVLFNTYDSVEIQGKQYSIKTIVHQVTLGLTGIVLK